MKKLIMIFVFAIAAPMASAADLGIVLGARSDSADTDIAGQQISSKTNFQGGGVAFFDIGNNFRIRSGFVYAQRSYTVTLNSVGLGDIKLNYFDIPIGVLYKFSDYGGAFVGTQLGLNVSKDCTVVGTCSNVNGSPMALQVGASFKFASQLGAELYYESIGTKLENNISAPKAVVANLMITFD